MEIRSTSLFNKIKSKHMRKLTVVFLMIIMLLGVVIVNAQEVREPEVIVQERPTRPLEVERNMDDVRPEGRRLEERPLEEPSVINNIPVNEVERPAVTRVRPENVQEARESRIREMKERRDAKQESVLQLREMRAEKIRERQDAFRARLQEIPDQARRDRAERLAENINRVNENLSRRYERFLVAMELVMDKIEIRIGRIEEANGADLTLVYAKIDEFRESTINARGAILQQQSKVYLVEIGSAETMTQDFRETMREMRNDHKAFRAEVIDPLRTLVRDIVTLLIKGLDRPNEGGGQQ